MIKLAVAALVGAISLTSAVGTFTSGARQTSLEPAVKVEETAKVVGETGLETLAVYYTPLSSTALSSKVGFGLAYHMALVYTDRSGRSFGVSAIPSNLRAPQTPKNLVTALFSMAESRESAFGTLIAETNNNRPFQRDGLGDYYTHDSSGRHYPRRLIAKSADLSDQWHVIVATYAEIGGLGLTYSPLTQNSNSLAAEALRRIGYSLDFSSQTYFTPGAFTRMPTA